MEVLAIYYYKLIDKILFTMNKEIPSSQHNLKEISEEEAREYTGLDNKTIYFLNALDPEKSRRSFSVSDSSLLFNHHEGINLLQKEQLHSQNEAIPQWIIDKITSREVMSINTQYPKWDKALSVSSKEYWKVNIVGLGDVGGTLLTGLRLVGGNYISEIGIYARSNDTIKRWELEMNQVISAFDDRQYPKVQGVTQEELFDCDMFIFCASKGVPLVGSKVKDVRMVQFEANSKIVSYYARMARESRFNGIFSVVSDPVDLLCKVALLESNKNSLDEIDYMGLAPDQIRGYGLGVMNARANFYANNTPNASHYQAEGRAFGPHGEDLIIADSILNYNDELSDYLTLKAREANLEVRKAGFKPYIAPALSSGTLSILATISGQWHYSATFMGGVFMGAKNRQNLTGIELERIDMPNALLKRIENTYERLASII